MHKRAQPLLSADTVLNSAEIYHTKAEPSIQSGLRWVQPANFEGGRILGLIDMATLNDIGRWTLREQMSFADLHKQRIQLTAVLHDSNRARCL